MKQPANRLKEKRMVKDRELQEGIKEEDRDYLQEKGGVLVM